MKKIYFLIFIMISVLTLDGHTNPSQQIISISIPKCGTHLITKCISLITGRKTVEYGPDDIRYDRRYIHNGAHFTVTPDDFTFFTHLPHNKFWLTHLLPLPEYIEQLSVTDTHSIFFLYRDPRDQIVSLMHWIRKMRKQDNGTYKSTVDQLSNAELITALIQGCKLHHSDDKHTTHIVTNDINVRYRTYLQWQDMPGICTVRFEDLVGSQGNGSDEAQWEAVRTIALHMGITLNDYDLNRIAAHLFGRKTFREGQIGSWKKIFTESHKKLFKEVAGQLLIDLGYETDFNW